MTGNKQMQLFAQVYRRLKSLVRERQRIWQIVYQGNEAFTLTLSKGNYKMHFQDKVKVTAAIGVYLRRIESEIKLLTNWVTNPETMPPYEIVAHYLNSQFFSQWLVKPMY